MMKMLKRLRRQFVATTVCTVGCILIAVLAIYCYSSYQSLYSKTQVALSQSLTKASQQKSHPGNSDDFPEIVYTGNGLSIIFGSVDSSDDSSSDDGGGSGQASTGTANTGASGSDGSGTSDSGTDGAGGGSGGGSGSDTSDGGARIDVLSGSFTPVYCVTVDTNGTIVSVNDSSVTMDADIASQAVQEALSSGKSSGEVSDLALFFQLSTNGSKTSIAFTDSSSLLASLRTTILTSIAIGVGALLCVFLVAILLARMAIRPVEDAWSKQRRFIADASHELKTPLTVILANTEIVRENQSSTVADQDKWLQGTLEESEKMEDLIQDLLMVAQTEEDTMVGSSETSETTQIDLSDVVEACAMQFEAVAYEQNVSMDYDGIDPKLQVKGTMTGVERLVRILIDNACKYAGDPGQVVIELRRVGKNAQLAVSNSGENISPEDLPHVFDRFFRADRSRTDDTGHGLGLSIAQNIAQGEGGSIAVTSDPGQMTTFTVTLPLV